MSVVISTEAGTYPVTLSDVKAHLCITSTDDDNYIGQVIIPTATKWAESITKRAFIERTYTERVRKFEYEHEFKHPPLLGVTSVSYQDVDGNTQTLSTDVYDVDIYSVPGRITLAYGETYPNIRPTENAVTYVYTAGYDEVPSPIISAILLLCGHLYENREQVTMGIEGKTLPMGADALLGEYVMKSAL